MGYGSTCAALRLSALVMSAACVSILVSQNTLDLFSGATTCVTSRQPEAKQQETAALSTQVHTFGSDTCTNVHFPDFESLHRDLRNNMSEKQLLVYRLSGGWGNRYDRLIFSLQLAIILDRALMLVETGWPKDEPFSGVLEPNIVDWRQWMTAEQLSLRLNGASGFTDVRSMDATRFLELSEVDVLDVMQFEPSHRDVRKWSPFLQERLKIKGLTYNVSKDKCMLNYMFRKSSALHQQIQNIGSILKRGRSPYLSMHVRTGPGEVGTHPLWTWFVDAKDALLKLPEIAKTLLQERGLSSETKWHVATDDVVFGNAMQAAYPSNVVLTNRNLSLLDGLHMERSHSKAAGCMLTFVDWFLMIESDIFIQGGGSSFSSSAIEYRELGLQDLGTLRGCCNNTLSIRASLQAASLLD